MIATAKHFRAREIRIVSGYRHPKYNLSLRKKGRQVASGSQHTQGHAIDFYLRDIPIRRVYRWLHKTYDGGVGFYARTRFVHVDVGTRRRWRGG